MADQLTARAPFADLAFSSAPGQGVCVVDRDALGIATVLVRKGQLTTLAQRVRERYGVELPRGPRRIAAGAMAFACTGPEAWLAINDACTQGFAATLKEALGDAASVADQSSGYAILRMTGPNLRQTLAKMLPIDLHPRAFAPGDVASTTASHVGATLWRLEDAADGSPVFEIAVFRSLAASFWHTLTVSAAEYGFVTQQAATSPSTCA
jgi:heterotetrameric sarcosine oxidase gamma subunit